jgi:hypothetical protein
MHVIFHATQGQSPDLILTGDATQVRPKPILQSRLDERPPILGGEDAMHQATHKRMHEQPFLFCCPPSPDPFLFLGRKIQRIPEYPFTLSGSNSVLGIIIEMILLMASRKTRKKTELSEYWRIEHHLFSPAGTAGRRPHINSHLNREKPDLSSPEGDLGIRLGIQTHP